ncbi:MAG: XRE family transcriptional regulator [Aquisalimonadaceae bacterium]
MVTLLHKTVVKTEEPARDDSRVGLRIKHARMTRGLTLRALATSIGCSVSALSKIENRKANPSITMLHRICGALGTNMATLFAVGEPDRSVVTRAAQRPLITTNQFRRGHGIQLERLIPHAPGLLLQGNIHMIEPGGYCREAINHDGEEVGLVLEGALELCVAGETYLANTGDSFFFRSDLPHSYRNPGDTLARVVWINTPPSS